MVEAKAPRTVHDAGMVFRRASFNVIYGQHTEEIMGRVGFKCRPKGRCHIMVPAGGANAEGWLAFRDVLARIEAYTSRAAPVQVSMPACASQGCRGIHGVCVWRCCRVGAS